MIAEPTAFKCPRCGTMRKGTPEPAPWCRHGDPMLPANRMEDVSPEYLAMIGSAEVLPIEGEARP